MANAKATEVAKVPSTDVMADHGESGSEDLLERDATDIVDFFPLAIGILESQLMPDCLREVACSLVETDAILLYLETKSHLQHDESSEENAKEAKTTLGTV